MDSQNSPSIDTVDVVNALEAEILALSLIFCTSYSFTPYAPHPPSTMGSLPQIDRLRGPFDYIVVGGGTAGLVVASRLSEDSNIRVLVIEAGEDHTSDPLVLTPGLVVGLYGKDTYDWNFTSVPQPTLNDRCINQARGKMLGGSSALNFMMLLYPTQGVLDAWGALGNQGWDHLTMAPYLRKFATVHPPPQVARDVVSLSYHDENLSSESGPIQVSFGEGYGPTNKAWIQTFASLGLEVDSDPRNGKALGAFQNPASIDPITKTRSYAASAYYGPQVRQRSNLFVITGTIVMKIVFDNSGELPVATGVEVQFKDGTRRQIEASSEIVLAAGALHSPQILELSGIGDQALLEELGIPVVVDNPNVGENMQDHPIVCQSFEVKDGMPSADILRDPNVLNALIGMYQAGGAGPLGQSVISVAYAPMVDSAGVMSAETKRAFFAQHQGNLTSPTEEAVRAVIERADEPAFQYLLFPSQITITSGPANMAEYLVPTQPENYITVMTILNHPFSRGSVHIASNYITKLPTWDPAYNKSPLDMELLARAVQFVERIVDPSTPFGAVLKGGGRRLPNISADSLQEAEQIVRERQISVFHVAGSCAMLPRDKGGVVDEKLRVYGTQGLRVVDASIFPIEPSGNIQAMVYAVAERAADLIKEDRRVASK